MRRELRKVRRRTAFLCLLGFLLSAYSLYVEMAKIKDPNYQAMCDISEHIACSKILTSEYALGFGFLSHFVGNDSILNQPNCLFGLFMYPIFFGTSLTTNPIVAMLGVIFGLMGVIVSLYLAYILFFVLRGICLVCISIYLVNLFLFVSAIRTYRVVKVLCFHQKEKSK